MITDERDEPFHPRKQAWSRPTEGVAGHRINMIRPHRHHTMQDNVLLDDCNIPGTGGILNIAARTLPRWLLMAAAPTGQDDIRFEGFYVRPCYMNEQGIASGG
jgi:hypothetical protein